MRILGRAGLATVSAALAGVVGIGSASAASLTTVTVNEGSLGNGWTLYADNDASGAFVVGPQTPPVGAGSFEFNIPTNGKVTLSTNTVAGEPLSAVDTVGYSTYRSGSSTMPGNVAPSLNMEICAGGVSDGSCVGYTTLVWEPVYAYGTSGNGNDPVVDDTWQTWDALGHTSTSYTGGWWSTRTIPSADNSSYVSLAEIQAANPDAVILSFGVNVGHGPAGTFDGNADALTLGLNGDTTVYDFEHAVTIAGKEECKDGGWMVSTDPTFKNQGDCVSYFASDGKTHPNA
jgi:hypothetical protein